MSGENFEGVIGPFISDLSPPSNLRIEDNAHKIKGGVVLKKGRFMHIYAVELKITSGRYESLMMVAPTRVIHHEHPSMVRYHSASLRRNLVGVY